MSVHLYDKLHHQAEQAKLYLSNSITKGTESSKGIAKLRIIGSNIANIAVVKAHRVVFAIMSTVYSNPEWINNKKLTDKVKEDISDLKHIIKNMKPSTNENEGAANLETIDLIQKCIKEASVIVNALKASGVEEGVTEKLNADLKGILLENEKKFKELEGLHEERKSQVKEKAKEEVGEWKGAMKGKDRKEDFLGARAEGKGKEKGVAHKEEEKAPEVAKPKLHWGRKPSAKERHDELQEPLYQPVEAEKKALIDSKIEDAQILEEKGDFRNAVYHYMDLLEDKDLDKETKSEVKLLLGLLTEAHDTNPKVRKEGFRYVKEAAEEGNPQAIKELARYYKFGVEGVVEKNPKEQKKWRDLKKENNREYEPYFSEGVDLYEIGKYKKAAKLFHKAAELGSPEARVELGLMYGSGQGVEKDVKKSVEFFRKAVRQDYDPAKYHLGIHYLASGDHSFANLEKAFVLIKSAAEQDIREAVNKLGEIHEKGLKASDKDEAIVKEDHEKAFKQYEKAYKQGSEEAIKNLIRCYKEGIGVEQDSKKADELELELERRQTEKK